VIGVVEGQRTIPGRDHLEGHLVDSLIRLWWKLRGLMTILARAHHGLLVVATLAIRVRREVGRPVLSFGAVATQTAHVHMLGVVERGVGQALYLLGCVEVGDSPEPSEADTVWQRPEAADGGHRPPYRLAGGRRPVAEHVLVAASAVRTIQEEIVSLMARHAAFGRLRLEPMVESAQVLRLRVASARRTGLHRLGRLGLLMRVVARGAVRLVGIVLRKVDERSHGVAREARIHAGPKRILPG
jgi:hypothetical protein